MQIWQCHVLYLQAQLSHAEVTGSMVRLCEEVQESKSACAQLQIEQACREQAWQKDMLSSQAEHDKQVNKHTACF